MKRIGRLFGVFAVTLALQPGLEARAQSGPLVPGTGKLIDFVGDQLEDPNWSFIHNHPKSSKENDEQVRFPRGESANGRWCEGPERGQPDQMEIVSTPAGGLSGSNYALRVSTLHSGVPGYRNFKVEQDDLVVDSVARIGVIPIAEAPSCVVRVYLPPAEEWENRTGPHFGFRTQVTTTKLTTSSNRGGLFRMAPQTVRELEPYWPGIWIHFRSKTDKNVDEDSAFLTVRGNGRGYDIKSREIPKEQFGWWTMGMSYTPDGQVHFYAKPGVGALTADDHLTSQFPYSYRAQKFENMFFNFCNTNDGKTWSTPFVIDQPELYVLRSSRIESIVQRKQQQMNRQAQQTRQKNRAAQR